jgi:putative transposase
VDRAARAILVERDAYLLELARYVVLNPVRAKMVRTAKDWPWSSYRATAGFEVAASFLTTDWILDQFGAVKAKAQDAYRRFVSAGRGVAVWENLRGQIYLGCDEFIKQHAPASSRMNEVPRAQRLIGRPPLDSIVNDARDEANIARAYAEYGYTMQEIAAHLGVHYATVSWRVRAKEEQRETRLLRDYKT